VFVKYAQALRATAERFFFPGHMQWLQLETTPRWPYSIRDRHTHILTHRRKVRGEWVFLLDADMLFEGPVEDDVIADGITVTVHPAMLPGTPVDQLTYERNPASVAYVAPGEGSTYHPGGIVGAPRAAFFELSRQVDAMCQADGEYTPIWQDESYLNRICIDQPPALILDQRYCAWWNRRIPDARIRALDKTPEEFAWRNSLDGAAAARATEPAGAH
jgi:hypothetical protein